MSFPGQAPIRVRVTVPFMRRGARLPLPGGAKVWGRCEFAVNPEDGGEHDFWVVLGFAHEWEHARVPAGNTLFICGEPPAKKRFPRAFYRQFGHVVDTHRHSRHPGLILHAPCLGWSVGGGQYRPVETPPPPKRNLVGVVCSSTAKTPGQRRRLRFLAALKEAMPEQIMHFGRGFRPVEDKLEAILPYRFQLVLENSQSPHYWTEKLADAYLGWAHPLYVGCPNVGDYFPRESFTPLNMDDLPGSVALIRRLLAEPEPDVARAALVEARRRMLEDYGVGVRCARLVEQLHRPGPPVRTEIRTYKAFRFWDRLIGRKSFPRTAHHPSVPVTGSAARAASVQSSSSPVASPAPESATEKARA